MFQNTLKETSSVKFLNFGDIEYVDSGKEGAFANNLILINDNSNNIFHQGNDFNSYTYGIRASTFKASQKLATKVDGFKCKGGWICGCTKQNVCGF